MDIYFVNSGPSDFFTPTTPLKNALYRNNGDGTFTDVTDKAGVAGGKFGMGVAAADYDADGNMDLYVTNYGPTFLYRNNGNGTFTDVTEKAGVTAPVGPPAPRGLITTTTANSISSSPALSLRQVAEPALHRRRCSVVTTASRALQAAPSRLFHNNGDGTFLDVSRESGIAAHPGKSFGAVATDVNNDGLMDLFVANDTMPNFLFRQQRQRKV